MRRSIALALSLAAAMLMVFFAASSASASMLCKENKSGCSAEEVFEKNHLLVAESYNFTLFTSIENITCAEAAVSFTVTDLGGEGKPVEAEVPDLSFDGCETTEGQFCGVGAKNLPFDAKFEGSGGNGSVTITGSPEPALYVNCGLTIYNCTLSMKEMNFNFSGGMPAVLTTEEVPLTPTGWICPETASWSAEYEHFFPMTDVFLVDGPAPGPVTRLCKVSTSPCPNFLIPQRHPIGTSIEGTLEGNSVFEFLYEGKPREPVCEGGTFTGKSTEAGKPLIGDVSATTFSKCGAGVCAVEAQSLPYRAEFENTSGGNGTMALTSGGTGSPKLEVNCGKAYKCIYKASSVSFSVTGGNPAKLAVSKTMEKDAASEAECGSTMLWTATYKLTKPAPMYVTS